MTADFMDGARRQLSGSFHSLPRWGRGNLIARVAVGFERRLLPCAVLSSPLGGERIKVRGGIRLRYSDGYLIGELLKAEPIL